MNLLAVQIIVFSMLIGNACTLTCMTCSFSDQRRCKYGTGLRSMVCAKMENQDAASNASQACVKIINPNSNDSRKYSRGCEVNVTANGLDFCSNFISQNKGSKCFTCNTDGCNGCETFHTTLIWFTVPAFIFLKFIL